MKDFDNWHFIEKMTSRETFIENRLYRESNYREPISQKMTLSRKYLSKNKKYYRETIYREKHSYHRDTLSRKLKNWVTQMISIKGLSRKWDLDTLYPNYRETWYLSRTWVSR